MRDIIYPVSVMATALAPFGMAWLAINRLPKAGKARAGALLAHTVALLAGYLWICWLAVLAWDHRSPTWMQAIRPLENAIIVLGTFGLFFGIFVLPILLGLMIRRVGILVQALRRG